MTATGKVSFNGGGFGARSSVQPLGKPAARYPAAVATDANLAIAANRQQTTLALTMNVGDTVMTVSDATQIVLWSLLSIDNEIVQATAIGSGNQVTVTRGFDGTVAAVHLTGAPVSGFIDAYHHNTLVAEIEAIEQTLGANLGNVPAVAYISAPAYNFAAQTPGGSLTVGTNSITLSPVPRGVNGTDVHHYLYISGGTGTAEAVLITGGTAVSGATSGTIFVTCAYAHSGAWTIQTATAGAQEAHNAAVGPVNFPAGTFDWYGPFWSNGNATIIGAGPNATTLRFNSTTMMMFDIERDDFILIRMTLQQMGTPVSGNMGVYTAGTGSGVTSAVCSNGVLEDLNIFGFFNGIYTHGGTSTFNLYRVNVNNSLGDGIVSRATQGYWRSIVCVSNKGNGITLSAQASPGSGGGPQFMSGIQTYNNGGWGLHSTTGVQISGTASFFNNDYLGEIYVSGAPTLAGWISDTNIQYAGQSITWGTNATAPGILIDTGTGAVSISNVQVFNAQGNSVVANSAGVCLTNCFLLGPGVGGNPANAYAFTGTAGSYQLIGNSISGPVLLGGNESIVTNNVISCNGTIIAFHVSSGGNQLIANNTISQVGSGAAFQMDTGVTYQKATNLVIGPQTVNGTRSIYSLDLA